MTQRTYGSQYDRNRTVTEDAASIRSQLKAAQKDGTVPADWKVSVRKRKSTYSWAIDVTLVSPRPIYAADPHSREWVRHAETGEYVIAWADRLTAEAQAASRLARELLDAHNHDGSDSQTDFYDVKFYSDVNVTTVPGVAEWAPEAAA